MRRRTAGRLLLLLLLLLVVTGRSADDTGHDCNVDSPDTLTADDEEVCDDTTVLNSDATSTCYIASSVLFNLVQCGNLMSTSSYSRRPPRAVVYFSILWTMGDPIVVAKAMDW